MEPAQISDPPVVAVVVVHQPGDWFDETLAALAAQDYPVLRFLFLVTGRADDEHLAEIETRIRAVLPGAFVRSAGGNLGFGATVNEALRLVEGSNGFFLVCHDDVAPAPDAVSQLVTELVRSNAGLVGPKLVEWDDPRRLQHVGLDLDRFGEIDPIVEPGELDQEQHDAVRDVFVVPSACFLVRADLFRTLGGFDPSIDFHGDDVELCWRVHASGARVVVVPDARVRHRELLEERRDDLPHGVLRARHRIRNVATLTGRSRLLGRSLQLVVLTVVELVVGLFTGRFGEAVASARGLLSLVLHTPAVLRRRRVAHSSRVVPEREILGLQVRGSARLASYLRGRETATYVTDGAPVRRWRTASYGPLLAWFLVLTALVIGSRSFIDRGVPAVGELLPLPPAGDLVDAYRSAWDGRGAGATAPVPTGWITVAMAMAAGLFRPDLAMTVWVLALVVIGAAGAWRLATVFPATRARIGVLVVYVGTPLVPGVLGTGDLTALVVYAVLPWLVHLARRAAGVDTADPDMADVDLTDGVVVVARRSWIRFAAGATVLLGAAAAVAPVVVVVWLLVGAVLAVATLIARASVRVAGAMAGLTAVSVVGAVVVNLPWSATWSWTALMGAQVAGGRRDGIAALASFSVDDQVFGLLALALYVPLLAAVAICRAWRLSWAARGALLVVVFLGLAVLADQDLLGLAAPPPHVLLVPAALGLGLAVGALAGGLGVDVLGRGFGWRQPLALAAAAATVIGIVPAAVAVGDGQWGAPRTTVPTLVAASLPADPADGDYRVLYLGDPRVLPVPGTEYRDGIAYALVDDGPLDLTDRWTVPTTDADDAIVDALDRIADGSVSRAGRLLAPLGIRYVVIPVVDGVTSTAADPIAVPVGMVAAIGDQLDLGQTFGPPTLEVFVNRSWFATTALLTGESAVASTASEPSEIVQRPVTTWRPLWVGADRAPGTPSAAAEPVGPGAIHLSIVDDDHWEVLVDGTPAADRTGFGITRAVDVGADGVASARYDEPASRTVWLVVQILLWLVVLVAASRARSPFDRRGGDLVDDETLIDLDDGSGDSSGAPELDPLLVAGRPTGDEP